MLFFKHTINVEVVIRNFIPWTKCSSTVVPQVKCSAFDSKPSKIPGQSYRHMRLASRGKSNGADDNPASMEQPARLSTIKLSRCHDIYPAGQVMYSIENGARFAPITRRRGQDFLCSKPKHWLEGKSSKILPSTYKRVSILKLDSGSKYR
jgi:hypothetical protein